VWTSRSRSARLKFTQPNDSCPCTSFKINDLDASELPEPAGRPLDIFRGNETSVMMLRSAAVTTARPGNAAEVLHLLISSATGRAPSHFGAVAFVRW